MIYNLMYGYRIMDVVPVAGRLKMPSAYKISNSAMIGGAYKWSYLRKWTISRLWATYNKLTSF